MRRLLAIALLLLPLLGEISAAPAHAEETPPQAPAAPGAPAAPAAPTAPTAHITYLTSSSAYLDAGQLEGLREGDELKVVRGGQTIATLKVTYLSSHRASCDIQGTSAPLAVGDTVLYSPKPRADAASGTSPKLLSTPAGPGAPEKKRVLSAFRGRVGARYTLVQDLSGNSEGYSQPGLDLRLDGYAFAGGSMDFNADVRSRRTYRTVPTPGDAGGYDSRVYRLALTARMPDPRQRVTVGRQFAPALASLSLFDGALYELSGEHLDGGLMAGTQPDPVDMKVSGDISEYGGYFRFHGLSLSPRHWAVTTGAIGSYTQGNINREFLYLQGQVSGRRLSAFATQEVDVNRGWKAAETGESTLAPTSTFASTYFRAGEHITLFGGYDNRRNVRLYRDRITPETEFDDSFRRGLWGGLSTRIGRHLLAGMEERSSQGGVSGRATSTSLNLGAEGLGRLDLSIRGRGTRFTNDQNDGSLASLAVGMNFGPLVRLEATGGTLRRTNRITPGLDENLKWEGLDLDFALGRDWYFLLSGQHNAGDTEKNNQVYASATYRF